MSLLKLHRLSVIWKNWMFNQECEHVFQVENSKDNEDVYSTKKVMEQSEEEGLEN